MRLIPVEAVATGLGLELQRDIEYGRGGDRPLHMHFLRPARRRRPVPCIVFVHGGSWRFGGRDDLLLVSAYLVRRGFAAATIEYRLTFEAPFPAQIEDCKCAVRFLRTNAAELGIDAARIGAFGPSAGGHLVALLGTAPDNPALEGDGGWAGTSSRVGAVVDWFGPSDLAALVGDALEGSIVDLLGGPLRTKRDVADLADPRAYVTPDCPPFLLMHGDRDEVVPLSQSLKLHESLIAAGVHSELRIVPGKGHAFLGVPAANETLRFFQRWL